MIFRMHFSTRNCQTTIHADGCSAVAGDLDSNRQVTRNGNVIWREEADSAEALRLAQEAEFEAEGRKMPKVRICACAKVTP